MLLPSELLTSTAGALLAGAGPLQCRRASSRFASTSQGLSTAAYNSSYGEIYARQQATAVALPWTADGEGLWVGQAVQTLDQQSSVAQNAAQQSTEDAAASVATREKPLKLNRDLLLYRAKLARQNAFRQQSVAGRLECYRKAEDALGRCIELDPVDARAYVALGKVLLLQRRYEEARKIYEDGIAVTGGRNEFLWQAWATLEASAGQPSKARKYFNAAVLVNPQHAASWHAWGMLEKKEGNLIAARDLWVKGIKKTQGRPNPYLYQSLAVLAGEMGFLEEARAWFRQGTATVMGAQSHALWQAWAQLEERSGEPKVVRFLYKKGLEASPASRYIHLAWAVYEKSEGRVDNARKLLERGHRMNPKDSAILQAWAVLEAENGATEEARKLFEQSVDVDPGHTHAWHAWAMMELRAGNMKRSRELFQSAVWSNPSNSEACRVWQAWSVLEFTVGNHALARSMCNCAVKADPTSDRAWDSWIYQEEKLGNEPRVMMLRKARAAGHTDLKLPASFGLPSDVAAEEPSIAETVMKTVGDWVRKFESKRSIVQRRPPSYLSPPDEVMEPAFLEQQSEALPPYQKMASSTSDDLDLPEIPARFRSGNGKAKGQARKFAATGQRDRLSVQ